MEKPTTLANPHYLKNKAFLAEIIKSQDEDKLTRAAEKMLILLANKTIKKMRYYNEDDEKDCKQAGMLALFSAWRKFNREKSNNPFAYFTECFKKGIARGWGELHYHKGDDDRTAKHFSMNTGNDGGEMFNF